MRGPITLAGFTFTEEEWSRVEADLRDQMWVENDESERQQAAPRPPRNDNRRD